MKIFVAEALPNAVGIFAEAITNGDVKELFKQMEEGKVGLKELNKVIDHMAKLSRQDLIAKMLDTPARKMEKLRTSVTRMFIALNEGGVLDAMVFALDKLADGVDLLTKGFKKIKPILSDMWDIVQPMLTLWATVWGVGKIYKLASAMRVLAVSVGLVSAAGSAGSIGGGAGWFSRIGKLIGKVGLLRTGLLLLNRAWLIVGASFKKSFIAVTILALVDMLETLQGKRTILTSLMGGDGVVATGAKILVGAFRTMQMLMEFVIAGFHGFFTGDWGFFQDSWNRWKDSMNSLFPFDTWMDQFMGFFDKVTMYFSEMGKVALAVGKFAVQPMNPFAAADAYGAIQGFNQFREMQNSKQSPHQGRGAITGITNSYQTTIEINGTGLDPKQIADEVSKQFVLRNNQAAANLSNFRVVPM